MIGNDIIDLKEAQSTSNWQRRGFLDKIFNSVEQSMIKAASNPFQMVWRLWSMKESGYKFYLQKNPNAVRGFYPSKINGQIISAEIGRVFIRGIELKTRTICHPDYLFTTAFADKNVSTESEIFNVPQKNYDFQSAFIREKILDYLAQKNNLDKSHLKIKKSKNKAPLIFYESKLLSVSCSLTHHGNYGGFSITSI